MHCSSLKAVTAVFQFYTFTVQGAVSHLILWPLSVPIDGQEWQAEVGDSGRLVQHPAAEEEEKGEEDSCSQETAATAWDCGEMINGWLCSGRIFTMLNFKLAYALPLLYFVLLCFPARVCGWAAIPDSSYGEQIACGGEVPRWWRKSQHIWSCEQLASSLRTCHVNACECFSSGVR